MALKKQDAFLGIDIGAGGMKLVELHRAKGRPQLWTYGVLNESLDIHIDAQGSDEPEPVGGELEKPESMETKKDITQDERVDIYAGYLKELLKTSNTTTTRATASLPVSYVYHTVVTLPVVDDKELGGYIEAEVKKLVSRPVEEMQIVHQKIPQTADDKKQKYMRVLVTAAPRSLISFYTAIFQKAGIQLEELETEAFALERSLVGTDSSVSMIVDMGAERTNFFIVDQGLPMTHRSIAIGGNAISQILSRQLGLSTEDVTQVKYDMRHLSPNAIPMDGFQSVMQPLIKEINYGFDLYLHQTGNVGKKPEKIVLTGGSSLFPIIAEYIKQEFDINTYIGDPWGRVVHQEGLKPILTEIGPRMAVSVGLAMRNILS